MSEHERVVAMKAYMRPTQNRLRPVLIKVIKQYPCAYINTWAFDEILCDHLKDSDVKYDGRRRWLEVNRSMRIRILKEALIEDFGYVVWSGTTKKVLYKPGTVIGSELERGIS